VSKRTPQPARPTDDEVWLDERLRELPDLEAPPTLIPRVMAALHAPKQEPVVWWQRTWWEWPRLAQAGSLVLLSAAIGLLGLMYLEIREAIVASYWQGALIEWRAQAAPLLRVFQAFGDVLAALVRTLTGAAGLMVAGVFLALYLACIGLGTVLYRLFRSPRVAI